MVVTTFAIVVGIIYLLIMLWFEKKIQIKPPSDGTFKCPLCTFQSKSVVSFKGHVMYVHGYTDNAALQFIENTLKQYDEEN